MNKQEQRFIETVWKHYRQHGRHNLPWKKTADPYKILVSEIMLQQTQVERVLPKYKSFLKKWGTARQLAAAPLSEVLKEWQGLGYNRRARMLHECAKKISVRSGKWPRTHKELVMLPGVGPYTAGAVMAFAFNKAVPIIETNIRTAYLHHFFMNRTDVTEKQILKKIEKTLDTANPREWYWALMDYGSFLKRQHGNNAKQARSYSKQSKFKGSDREVRGAIIRELATGNKSQRTLLKLPFDEQKIEAQLKKLQEEGMVVKQKNYRLPD